ncbi:hypothetical protein I7I51_06948 [Histoplasma capsulatum]|uniref:Uncharacterized protein n=1 Tax=Ajellomyces capsulatus TaxID=5037 RepID=A0A8A1MPU8_AJECA|nr:hypothetical protein I7I51_06948 [Histoplasma capsulatum]
MEDELGVIWNVDGNWRTNQGRNTSNKKKGMLVVPGWYWWYRNVTLENGDDPSLDDAKTALRPGRSGQQPITGQALTDSACGASLAYILFNFLLPAIPGTRSVRSTPYPWTLYPSRPGHVTPPAIRRWRQGQRQRSWAEMQDARLSSGDIIIDTEYYHR